MNEDQKGSGVLDEESPNSFSELLQVVDVVVVAGTKELVLLEAV